MATPIKGLESQIVTGVGRFSLSWSIYSSNEVFIVECLTSFSSVVLEGAVRLLWGLNVAGEGILHKVFDGAR